MISVRRPEGSFPRLLTVRWYYVMLLPQCHAVVIQRSLSTPYSNYTMPLNVRPRNPHHIFEYTPEELSLDVGRRFRHFQLLGQTISPRFVVSPFTEDQRR